MANLMADRPESKPLRSLKMEFINRKFSEVNLHMVRTDVFPGYN